MLTAEVREASKTKETIWCQHCYDIPADVTFRGHAVNLDLHWCRNCALHLSRMILEDLCEVITGGRH